jgi:outer membrane protein OmpA-like peptidoglycan-associated protein
MLRKPEMQAPSQACARIALCALVLLAGCASAPKPKEAKDSTAADIVGTANLQAGRITDERIVAERKAIEALQARIAALNQAGVPIKNYGLAKAQCWLDTAKSQFHENDRSGYVEQALAQSHSIIKVLENDKSAKVGEQTPMIAASDKLRDDLWQRLMNLKSHRGFECAAQTVACAEVRLVRAGHANQQTGWRQASPHIAMVEDAVKAANAEAEACVKPTLRPAAVPPAPAVAATPTAAPSTTPSSPASPPLVERVQILSDTLFAFGKSDLGSMLAEGRSQLDSLARRIAGLKRIERIDVVGYADRIGSDERNAMLSGARAATVRDYLLSKGVRADQITATGKGRALPGANCPEKLPKKAKIACLQSDRRVDIEVFGQAK